MVWLKVFLGTAVWDALAGDGCTHAAAVGSTISTITNAAGQSDGCSSVCEWLGECVSEYEGRWVGVG